MKKRALAILMAATVAGTITNAGTEANTVTGVQILRGEGENAVDVTECYSGITTADGTLTVNPRTVTLTSGDAEKY